jgi:hypothetical protein
MKPCWPWRHCWHFGRMESRPSVCKHGNPKARGEFIEMEPTERWLIQACCLCGHEREIAPGHYE